MLLPRYGFIVSQQSFEGIGRGSKKNNWAHNIQQPNMNKRTESNDIIFNKYHQTMLGSLNSLTEWADEVKQRKRFIQFIRLNK